MMFPALWNETFPLACTARGIHLADPDQPARSTPLRQRDDITLVCSDDRCGAEYQISDGIPVLLSPNRSTPSADYDDELIAQMYAEMHFATFATEPRQWNGKSGGAGDHVAVARSLLDAPDLTGSFYATMAEIVLAHLPSPTGLIADVACGMARMAFEFETSGWHGRYLGIDLSPRLLAEASRAFTGEEVSTRFAAEFGNWPRSKVVSIQAPKISSERSLLAVGDAARLALASQSCEAVLALNLIDRVDDPEATVREMWRCVAPGGVLVLTDPFQWQDQALDKRIYSFDAVERWLEDARRVELPASQRSVVFAMHRRASREVVIYDDAVAIFARPA
jgi:ubiquinone/menaquinone biosynthesis C-methylase UbiE/uncharacterized protein YbaR (Trm112 family)